MNKMKSYDPLDREVRMYGLISLISILVLVVLVTFFMKSIYESINSFDCMHTIIEPDHVIQYETGETVVVYDHGKVKTSDLGKYALAPKTNIVVWEYTRYFKNGDIYHDGYTILGLRDEYEIGEVCKIK